MVSQRVSEKIRRELWGFCALIGIICVHTGIVLTVFALKDVTSHPELLKIFGIFLIILGVIATLASWYFHRQTREKRPMFPCCRRFCCNCICDADFLELNDYDRDKSKRRRGNLERSKSVAGTGTGLPTTSGFSTPEFKMYSDFLKRDSHITQQDNTASNFNPDQPNAQNKLYLHHTNQIHPEKRKHRHDISTISK